MEPDTRCFYVFHSSAHLTGLFNHFRKKAWYVDYKALQKNADKKEPKPVPHKSLSIDLPLLETQLVNDLERYRKWLREKRLSQNTINTYVEVTAPDFRTCFRFVKLLFINS